MIQGFILGFASCALFMSLVELVAHLIDRRRILKRLEQLRSDPMAQVQCDPMPWVLNDEPVGRLISENRFFHAASVTQGEQ